MQTFSSGFGSSSESSGDSLSGSQSRQNSTSQSGYRLDPTQAGRLNSLYPQLQGVSNLRPSMAAGHNLNVGPASAYPTITRGVIWDPQQIQASVNQSRANNDAGLQSQQQVMRRDLAGRGYGAYSPLGMSMANNAQAIGRGMNEQGETQLRWGAAEGNAAHRLKAEMADVQRTGMVNNDAFVRDQLRVDQDLRRRQIGMQRYGIEWGAKMGAMGEQGSFLQQHPYSTSNSNSFSQSFGQSSNNQSSNSGSPRQLDTGDGYQYSF